MENAVLLLEDDDDLLLLAAASATNRVYHPLNKGDFQFKFTDFSDDLCYVNFRFYKEDLIGLRELLRFPITLRMNNGVSVSSLEALCILLRRLAYPNRLFDLMGIFPRTPCELSRIFNFTVTLIITLHVHLLTDVDEKLFSHGHLQSYSEAIRGKGSAYHKCIGFIDGTVRPICRLSINQREYYNGHRREHALKFQSLMLPNGIIGNLYGPVSGRRHDAFLLDCSGLNEKLENAHIFNNTVYHLYGDPAYPLLPTLIVPFRKVNLSLNQKTNK